MDETIALPGATISGFSNVFAGRSFGVFGAGVPGSTTGPRELNDATSSSLRLTVPLVFREPMVSAPGVKPGDTMPPTIGIPFAFLPWLPAEETTTMLGVGSYLAGFAFEKAGERDEALLFYEEALAYQPYASLRDPIRVLSGGKLVQL